MKIVHFSFAYLKNKYYLCNGFFQNITVTMP